MRWKSLFATVTATLAISVGVVACTSTQTSTALTAPSSQKCQFQVSNTPASFSETGGSGTVSINTTRDCGWSATTSASWVSMASNTGQGEATVSYSVSANSVPASRSASISVEGQSVQLNQAAAPCRYVLSKSQDTIAYSGGLVSIGITTLTGCGWSSASDSSWAVITAGASGNASGTVTVSVAANPGAERTAHLAIGGQAFTLTQTAAPPPAPSPTPSPGPTPTPSPSPTPTPTPPPASTQVSGEVFALTGKCPTLTFVVADTMVKTSEDTDFNGGKCKDLSMGDSVTVTGQAPTPGLLNATVVETR